MSKVGPRRGYPEKVYKIKRNGNQTTLIEVSGDNIGEEFEAPQHIIQKKKWKPKKKLPKYKPQVCDNCGITFMGWGQYRFYVDHPTKMTKSGKRPKRMTIYRVLCDDCVRDARKQGFDPVKTK